MPQVYRVLLYTIYSTSGLETSPAQFHSKSFLSGSLQSSEFVLAALASVLLSLRKGGMGWVPAELPLDPQPWDSSPHQASDPHFGFPVDWRLASNSPQQPVWLGTPSLAPDMGRVLFSGPGALPLTPWVPPRPSSLSHASMTTCR